MSEHIAVKTKCFIDEFNLPLSEDVVNDFYTLEEIKQEVNKRIVKLASVVPEYKLSVGNIASYEFIDRNGNIAEIEPVAAYKYVFRISKLAARKRNEKYLDTIIYHELCHVLQVNFLLNSNVLCFEGNDLCYEHGQEKKAETLLDTDDGHTILWYCFVNIVNNAFVINPPVDRFMTDKDVSDIFLEDTFRREKLRVKNTKFVDDFGYLFKDEPV